MGEFRSIGRYQLLRVIGRGGMGVVYLALDPILQRLAAIKVLSPHLSSDETVIARFINEARIAASLQHPNIVTVYEAGQDGEFVFMAMEYVEGKDLATLLRERGRLHPDEAIAILKAVASALDYAHQRGVIHRDVKPSNVLVSRDGVVKLMDFGIARVIGGERHTKTGVLVGTPEYMAPELWEGKEADKMADLYALGVMAYEMLTGEVPFTGDTPIAVGYKHVHGEVPRTGMGRMVDEVMRVAMAKERERRFQSGMALVMALEKALEGREISSHSSSESITIIDRRKSEEITRDSQRILPTPSNDMKTERRFVAQKEVNPITAIFACIIVVMVVVLSYWLFYEQPWKYRSLSSQSYQSQKSLSLFSQPSVTMSHKEEKSILSQQMEATEQLISQLNKAVEILDQKPQSSNIRVQKVWVEGEKCEYCFKNHGKVFVLLSNGIVKKLTNDGVDPRISKDGYKVGWLEKAVFAKGGNIENAYCYTIKAILYDLRENKIIKECDIFGEPIPQWVKELWGEDVY